MGHPCLSGNVVDRDPVFHSNPNLSLIETVYHISRQNESFLPVSDKRNKFCPSSNASPGAEKRSPLPIRGFWFTSHFSHPKTGQLSKKLTEFSIFPFWEDSSVSRSPRLTRAGPVFAGGPGTRQAWRPPEQCPGQCGRCISRE